MTVPDLIKTALRTKIASKDGIDSIYRSAVRGVAFDHEVAAPPGCPTAPGRQYFRLNQTGRFWDEIRSAGAIGVYTDPDLKQAEVSLLIRLN
jgi:predicted component of type VI protein secretion system